MFIFSFKVGAMKILIPSLLAYGPWCGGLTFYSVKAISVTPLDGTPWQVLSLQLHTSHAHDIPSKIKDAE